MLMLLIIEFQPFLHNKIYENKTQRFDALWHDNSCCYYFNAIN